jgi:hypothetical protein
MPVFQICQYCRKGSQPIQSAGAHNERTMRWLQECLGRGLSFPFFPLLDCGILGRQTEQETHFMAKDPEERYRQADYNLETAEYMFAGGCYFFSKLQFTLI